MAEEKAGPKFGVAELAEAMGIEQTSARVALRNKGIEKKGSSYGWNTRKELDEVIAKLKTKPAAASAKPADKKAEKKVAAKSAPATKAPAKAKAKEAA